MSLKRQNFLAVSKMVGKSPRPILGVLPKETIDVGIRYRSHFLGLVPQWEVEDARIELGFRLHEWHSLDRMERAIIIARYRIKHAIKNHAEEAMQEAAERKAKQNVGNQRGRR